MHKGLIGAVLCLFLLVYAVEAKGFLKNSWDQLGTWVFSRRLHPEGLIAGAPPCSLFTAASSSVNKRTKLHPCGNLANYKVRLSQRIWGSFVTRILQDFYSSNLLLFGHVVVFHAVPTTIHHSVSISLTPCCIPLRDPNTNLFSEFMWILVHQHASDHFPTKCSCIMGHLQNGTSGLQDLPRWCFWCWSCKIPQLCDWWLNSHVARGGLNNCSSSPWLAFPSSTLSKPTWVFSITTCASAATSWRTWGFGVMDHDGHVVCLYLGYSGFTFGIPSLCDMLFSPE